MVTAKRILLKISGEALGAANSVFNSITIQTVARQIAEIVSGGTEVALVIGGGNIFRGSLGETISIERVTGDHMGMLATVINALAVSEALRREQCEAAVLSSINMYPVAEQYSQKRALDNLKQGRVVLLAGGTGNPYFTTDTAASLRAVEIKADLLVKATKVDGVYDKDPALHADAKKIDKITYLDVIQKQLRVMDLTAVSMCMENSLPVRVFNLFEEGALKRIVAGENTGTLIGA
ncbi:MAG: UMP kinase [Spirochaetota bacterium]